MNDIEKEEAKFARRVMLYFIGSFFASVIVTVLFWYRAESNDPFGPSSPFEYPGLFFLIYMFVGTLTILALFAMLLLLDYTIRRVRDFFKEIRRPN